ncbi:MAG: orotidine 5'-phosphate decarboxylase / HUMPS family protein [Acidilobaceae archaeon]
MKQRLAEALSECSAFLQVALDSLSLSDALRVARALPESREVVVEAGTPLVKAWGMASVRALRSSRPWSLLVVDTKTVDAARLEAESVASAGGDAFTVLASASEETLRSAVEAARELGLGVYADTIAVRDPFEAAQRVSDFGVDVVIVHVGIDVQRSLGLRASSLVDVVKKLAETVKPPVAVAGGIKPREAGVLAEAGARVIVIGSAIVKSGDPKRAALEALESLREAGARCR